MHVSDRFTRRDNVCVLERAADASLMTNDGAQARNRTVKPKPVHSPGGAEGHALDYQPRSFAQFIEFSCINWVCSAKESFSPAASGGLIVAILLLPLHQCTNCTTSPGSCPALVSLQS